MSDQNTLTLAALVNDCFARHFYPDECDIPADSPVVINMRRLKGDTQNEWSAIISDICKRATDHRISLVEFMVRFTKLLGPSSFDWSYIITTFTMLDSMVEYEYGQYGPQPNHLLRNLEEKKPIICVLLSETFKNWITANGGWDKINEIDFVRRSFGTIIIEEMWDSIY
jgi:hypothetical protein